MGSDTATFEQLAHEVGDAIRESSKFMFLVRDKELQEEQVSILQGTKNRIKRFKYGAAEAGEARMADKLFQFQCRLNSQISFLKMWINLKGGEPRLAWGDLIDAQEYVSMATRAAEDDIGLVDFMSHLEDAENVVFPGFSRYFSVGMTLRGGMCSICHDKFGDCKHIEGLVYSGRLCVRVHPEPVEVDHTAMVEDPRDRRCIITEIETSDGYRRDYITWQILGKAEESSDGSAVISGMLLSYKLLEID